MAKTREKLLDKLFEAHHVAYYQLISIIQGSVSAYLIGKVINIWSTIDAHGWVQFFCTFLLIIVVWNAHVRAITQVEFPPKFVDALIPFLFGIGQSILIFASNNGPGLWFGALAFVSLIGWYAYKNTENNVNKYDRNHDYKQQILKQCKIHKYACLSSVLACAGTAVASWWFTIPAYFYNILALIIILGYLVKDEILWNRLIKYALGETENV